MRDLLGVCDVGKVALAERMAIHEKEVRRVLDPDHSTGLDRLAAAAEVFGHTLIVGAAPHPGSAKAA